jgi:hypothetical protein
MVVANKSSQVARMMCKLLQQLCCGIVSLCVMITQSYRGYFYHTSQILYESLILKQKDIF